MAYSRVDDQNGALTLLGGICDDVQLELTHDGTLDGS